MTRKHDLHVLLLPAVLLFLPQPQVYGYDEFGRLFTTPGQRQRLEEMRNIEPEERITIDEDALLVEEEVEEEKETLSVDALTLRGLVHRSAGNNTAWINDSNTFEGGLSSQHIDIGDIEEKSVRIHVPATNESVNLGVGQTFDPLSGELRDIIEDETARLAPAAE